MVKRKEKKLEYAFKQEEKGVKNKDCAFLCNVEVRWSQKLYADYKMTGKIPGLDKSKRPTRILAQEEKL